MEKENITIDDFKKMDIRVGTILSVEKVEGATKLLKLEIDLDEEKPRQIISGIAEYFLEPEKLVGTQVPVLANLEPREIHGFLSEGMILAISGNGGIALLNPDEPVPNGSVVK